MTVGSVRRILVALNGVTSASAGLELAIQMAGQLHADLEGLFVEDSDLLRVAALPFTRQINFTTAGETPLETADVEMDMTRRAGLAQQRLAAAAASRHIKWSFRRVRGRVSHEIEMAAAQADFVVVEGGRTGARLQDLQGSMVETVLQSATRTMLVARTGALATEGVAVIYDGSTGAAAALSFALRIMPRTGVLTVFLDALPGAALDELETKCRSELADAGVSIRFAPLDKKDWPAMCQSVSRNNASLFVIAHDSPLLAGTGMRKMLSGMKCPVCVVR